MDTLTNPASPKQKPLTTQELADHLSVTTRTLSTWRARGKIPYLRITARCFRYNLDQVERALAET
jgi:excisionase family DNA binding protein